MSSDVCSSDLTDANFATEVESGSGVTVVDFWAPWCGPCRFISPIIEELASEYEGRVKIGKLNVDDNPMTASAYGIRSIPTIGFFVDGQTVVGVVAAVSKAALKEVIETQLAAEDWDG